MKRFWLYVWTFPMCLVALVNSRKVKGSFGEYRLGLWRWWPWGDYSFAAWPAILLRPAWEDYIDRRPSGEAPLLFRHEARHLKQQEKWGPLFLPIYGGHFLWNYFVPSRTRFDRRRAYLAIVFEQDARRAEIELDGRTTAFKDVS